MPSSVAFRTAAEPREGSAPALLKESGIAAVAVSDSEERQATSGSVVGLAAVTAEPSRAGAARVSTVSIMRVAVHATRAAAFLRHASRDGTVTESEAVEAEAVAEALVVEAEAAEVAARVSENVPACSELDELDHALEAIEDVMIQVPVGASWAEASAQELEELIRLRSQTIARMVAGADARTDLVSLTKRVGNLVESMQSAWETRKNEADLPNEEDERRRRTDQSRGSI